MVNKKQNEVGMFFEKCGEFIQKLEVFDIKASYDIVKDIAGNISEETLCDIYELIELDQVQKIFYNIVKDTMKNGILEFQTFQ